MQIYVIIIVQYIIGNYADKSYWFAKFWKYAYISYRILVFTLFQYLVEGQDTLRNSDLIAYSKNWF